MSDLQAVSEDLDGETISRYWPAESFIVDGLLYVMPRGHPNNRSVYARPMVWIYEDGDSYCEIDAGMYHSDPPTEFELDQYVRHDTLPTT